MLQLTDVDLNRDPLAGPYVKHEIVQVSFATEPGVIESRVGPNHYAAGDALVTGCDGDRWSVSAGVFALRYAPEPGTAPGTVGAYHNVPSPVLARRFEQPFTVTRASGDRLSGKAGDWLLQYGMADHGVADAGRFARVYRALTV